MTFEFENEFAYDADTVEAEIEAVSLRAYNAGHDIRLGVVRDGVAHGYPTVRARSESVAALVWYVLNYYGDSGDDETMLELLKSIEKARPRTIDLEPGQLFSINGGQSWYVCAVSAIDESIVPVYTSAQRDDDAPTVRLNVAPSDEITLLP